MPNIAVYTYFDKCRKTPRFDAGITVQTSYYTDKSESGGIFYLVCIHICQLALLLESARVRYHRTTKCSVIFVGLDDFLHENLLHPSKKTGSDSAGISSLPI